MDDAEGEPRPLFRRSGVPQTEAVMGGFGYDDQLMAVTNDVMKQAINLQADLSALLRGISALKLLAKSLANLANAHVFLLKLQTGHDAQLALIHDAWRAYKQIKA